MKYKQLKEDVAEYAKNHGLDENDLEVNISLAPLEDESGDVRYFGEVCEVVVVKRAIILSSDGKKIS